MMITNHSTSSHIAPRWRKGGTLISLIAVMLFMGILGASVISLTRTSEHSYLTANSGSRAYYLAESGLRYAQQVYCSDDGWLHGRQQTLTLQSSEQVDIIRIGDFFWATAIVHAGTAMEARARVPMPVSPCGGDPTVGTPNEFALLGESAINLRIFALIQGDIAIAGDDVDVQGVVDGNIFAKDVTASAFSWATVTGDIFASGMVDLWTGSFQGDIHSEEGIRLTGGLSVIRGWLFSNGTIEVDRYARVRGHIHSCGGDVSIGGNATIGTASDPVEIRAAGDVIISSNATVYGDVHAGGTISLDGTIVGNAYAGGAITNTGSISGTEMNLSPNLVKEPICPNLEALDEISLPDATVFTAGGSDVSLPGGESTVLPPGSYGALSSPSNSRDTRLYLNAGATDHGNYYFDSVNMGRRMALYLNLSGSYDIRIFVEGNVEADWQQGVFISTDGTNYVRMTDSSLDPQTAARVYWESHGDYTLLGFSGWFGSVYTPYGYLSVAVGSNLYGSFFSGGGHRISASRILHIPPNYFDD